MPSAVAMSTIGVFPASCAPTAGSSLILSQPKPVDLSIYRGDSGRMRVEVTDPDGLPLDVSAATWDCDFRATTDATVVLASLTATPVPGQTNAVDLVLSAEDSATLNADAVWDLEMTLNGMTTTLMAGKVLVTKDVSRS